MANKRIYWMLTILSMVAYAWIGFHLLCPEYVQSDLTVCLFKHAMGMPCPSCGVTRSVLLLLGGNFQEALLLNPLGGVAAILLAAVPLWILVDLVTRKNTLSPVFLWTEKKIRSKKIIYMPLVVLVLLNWGWNILKDL